MVGLVGLKKQGLLGSNNVVVSREALQRSLNIWNSGEFLPVAESDRLRQAIDELLSGTEIPKIAKEKAGITIHRLLEGYANRDWESFASARIPSSQFRILPDVAVALRKYGPGDAEGLSLTNVYRAIWEGAFEDSPLFSSVSFVSSSLTVLKLNRTALTGYVQFPEFTERTNQNWGAATPTLALNYDQLIEKPAEKESTILTLRFFFFGSRGDEEGARPFMFVFVWDEQGALWVPWQFTHAQARPTKHTLRFF
ncbi:MAG TPA: hypothetical protein DCY13_24395 [Verrucomicrobiales bacterium]|nr:hypothetical protein [Verrucomicrobiales bacterium]